MADTTQRLLRLLSLLQARPVWRGPDLAERLGVTTRTVRRDVDRLRDLGYPVDSAPGVTGGYQLGPGADLPPLLLDDDEAVAAAVCLRAGADGSVAGVAESALAALGKLEQVLPSRLRPTVAALTEATVDLRRPAGRGGADAGALVALAGACRESLRTRFVYRDARGRSTERRVDPYRLVHTGRRWYLLAHDADRDDWRTFRLDRLADVEVTGHRFQFDDPPDAARFVAEAITAAPYLHTARVLLDAPIAELADRVPPTTAVLEAVDDRTTRLVAGGNSLTWFALHVVALGVPFTVESPDSLRDTVAELGARLAAAAAPVGTVGT